MRYPQSLSLSLSLCLCVSLSSVTQKVVDEFWGELPFGQERHG